MNPKFKTVLQAGAEEDKAEEQKQEKLKRKFGIQGRNVVVVEGTSTAQFVVKTIAAILRFVATVIIIALAFIGIVALFYEAPRMELFVILHEVLNQINKVVPIGWLLSWVADSGCACI